MGRLGGKIVANLARAFTSPRRTARLISRRLVPVRALSRDPQAYHAVSAWTFGEAERVRIEALFPGISRHEVTAPRALDQSDEVSASVLEVIVLGALAKELQPKRILEIGTFDGHTALVLSRNAPDDATVVTVDLPPDSDGDTRLEVPAHMANMTDRHNIGRQFRDTHEATRIKQVFGDSAELDWSALGGPFDLVFVDGCHAEAYVRSDTKNALSVLEPSGVLVWHDYGTIEDVSRVVDSFSDVLDINAVMSTSLAVGWHRPER